MCESCARQKCQSVALTQEGSGRAEAVEHDDGTTYDQLQVTAQGGGHAEV